MEACSVFLQRLDLMTEAEDLFGDIILFDDYMRTRYASILLDFEEILSGKNAEVVAQCLKFIYSDIFSSTCCSAKRKIIFDILTYFYEKQVNDLVMESLEFLFELMIKSFKQKSYHDITVDTLNWLSRLLAFSSYKDCQIILFKMFHLIKSFKNTTRKDKITTAVISILQKLLSRTDPLLPTYQIYGAISATFEFVNLVSNRSLIAAENKSVFYQPIASYYSNLKLLSKILSIPGRNYLYPIIQHSQCINSPPNCCSFTPQHYKVDFKTLAIKTSESAMCLDGDLLEQPRYDLIASCLLQPYCVNILERALLRPEKVSATTAATAVNSSSVTSGGSSSLNLINSKSSNSSIGSGDECGAGGLEYVLSELFYQMMVDSNVDGSTVGSKQWTNLVTNMQLLILKNQSIKVPIFIRAVSKAVKKSCSYLIPDGNGGFLSTWGENGKRMYYLLSSFLTIMSINANIEMSEDMLNQIVEIDHMLSSSYPQTSCLADIQNSSLVDISRLILWFNLKMKLNALNHVQVSLPPELQLAQSELHSCFKNANKDMSLLVKLLNFSNVFEPSSSQLQKKLIIEFLNSSSNCSPVKLIGNIYACGQMNPIDFTALSNLTMSVRIVLYQQISAHWRQLMLQLEKAAVPVGNNILFPSPALIETYGRLYMDSFFETFYQPTISIDYVIQSASTQGCYRTFPICAEILVNMLPRANLSYLFTFCSHCINISNSKTRNKYLECVQFYSVLENSCIQIMSCFGVKNFIALVEKYNASNSIASLISPDNEDYNKLFMLNVSRCMNIAGVDCFDKGSYKQFFDIVQSKTPHMLSHHMLHIMPAQVIALYQNQPFFQPEVSQKLKMEVENEYHNFLKLLNRSNNEVINYTLQLKGHYFLCFFWKLLLASSPSSSSPSQSQPATASGGGDNATSSLSSSSHPPVICATILEQIGPKNLTKHIQTFCDFVNYEMLANMSKASKFIEAINRMIWEYDVISIDRFVFAMILRPFGQKDDQVSLYFIHLLLQNSQQLKERIDFFCDLVDKVNLTDAETKGGWFSNWQLPYNQKYEERFHYEGIYRVHNMEPANRFYFPTYFSNLCIRFVPIFDLILTRFLEIPLLFKHLSTLLTTYGKLFRLNKQPITFLYKTVAYYKKIYLLGNPEGARMLVMAVHEAFKNVKPPEWLVSVEFLENAVSAQSFQNWNPATSYVNTLIDKLTLAVFNSSNCEPFCRFNWEQEEFTSVASHVLYCICLEILCLPNLSPAQVVSHLFELALTIESDLFNKYQKLNSVSLIVNHLPPIYYTCIEQSLVEMMCSEQLISLSPHALLQGPQCGLAAQTTPITATTTTQSNLAIDQIWNCILKAQYLYYHANNSHLNLARQFLSTKLKPMVKSEQQLIVFCHLLSPFFLIYSDNKPIQKSLYSDVVELLPAVMHNLPPPPLEMEHGKLVCEDVIVDLLYYGKYTCIGDDLKPIVDANVLLCGESMTKKMKFY